MKKRIGILILLFLVVSVLPLSSKAFASDGKAKPEICPDGVVVDENHYWSPKQETTGGTYPVPGGYYAVQYCIKAGLETGYINIPPTSGSVTVPSTYLGKDTSHWSVLFEKITNPTQPPVTPTGTSVPTETQQPPVTPTGTSVPTETQQPPVIPTGTSVPTETQQPPVTPSQQPPHEEPPIQSVNTGVGSFLSELLFKIVLLFRMIFG